MYMPKKKRYPEEMAEIIIYRKDKEYVKKISKERGYLPYELYHKAIELLKERIEEVDREKKRLKTEEKLGYEQL